MIEGGVWLGSSEEKEFGGRVPKEVDELANSLATEHGDDVADRYMIDDEIQFHIRSAIWHAVVDAARELPHLERSDWGSFGSIRRQNGS